MAFFNRAGSILRQSVSKRINHEISVASCQIIRCMSSSKLFVGGLTWATDDMNLREAFSAFGKVLEAKVAVTRETGRPRGFGFVTFADTKAASAAIEAMDQRQLHGQTLRVNFAVEKPQFGGRLRGGGGGFGDGGSYVRNNNGGEANENEG